MNNDDPLNYLVTEYLQSSFTWLDENQLWLGCAFGLTLFCTVLSKKEQRNFWGRLLVPQLIITLLLIRAPISKGFWEWLEITVSQNYPLDWLFGSVISFSVGLVLWRQTATVLDWLKFRLTKKTKISRRQNTDIKELYKAKPVLLFLYRVHRKFNQKNRLVLGKYPSLRLCSLNLNMLANEHILIRGSSGYGKTAILQLILVQYCIRQEFITIFNPKFDDDLLKISSLACSQSKLPFCLLDLEGSVPQFSLFEGKDASEIEEIILSDPQFCETRSDGDFYTNFDRNMIFQFSHSFDQTKSLSENWSDFQRNNLKNLKNADKFIHFMTELSRLPVSDAKPGTGCSFEELIMNGGLLYLKCTILMPRVRRLQGLLVVSITQWLRKTKNNSKRPFARLIFEEISLFINENILSLYGVGRSDRCGVTVLHQSRTDMISNYAGVDPERALGCIEDNADTQILFRTKSVETSKHAAQQTGDAIAEEDMRNFETNLTLSEVRCSNRSLREVIRPHLTRNKFMTLRKFEAILIGQEEGKVFRFAPYNIPKTVGVPTPTTFPIAIAELKSRSESTQGGAIDVRG